MAPDRQIGFLISLVKQLGGRAFEKMLVEYGIEEFNGSQGRILYVLWNEDSIAIRDLAERTGLANATMTSMLDRMEKQELVRRMPDKTDRRKILIALTDKARSLREVYEDVSRRMGDLYYQDFSKDEVRQVEGYLRRILENLKK